MIDVFVLVSTAISAPCARVWSAVIDFQQRPSLISATPLTGRWPEETATAHVVMDKGTFKMQRTETVVLNQPERRLMIKVDVEELRITSYLDYQVEPSGGGCRLSLSSLVAAPDSLVQPAGAEGRARYAAGTKTALEETLAVYRRKLEVHGGGH